MASSAVNLVSVNRIDVASWLSGPRAALEEQGYSLGYRGQRLELPEAGPGSIAGFGRRIAALTVDWLACMMIANIVFASSRGTPSMGWLVLGIFCAEKAVFTALGGSSFGQRVFGIRVASLRAVHVTPPRALLRSILICLVIPAVVWDRDGRSLADRAASTAVVQFR